MRSSHRHELSLSTGDRKNRLTTPKGIEAVNGQQTHAVTGAFGYSGKYITQRLLDKGHHVITLTNSPNRGNLFDGHLEACPYHFDKLDRLTDSLRGVSILYNTYWVRFNHKLFTHAEAVRNTQVLFEAAKTAGVERIVHVSITNPSADSPLEYFRCKAELESKLTALGLSYCILWPAVLFGKEDILVNNIAWAIRRLPVIGVFGNGNYKMQPIYVDDLAELAVAQGESRENVTINAIGSEAFTYREFVASVKEIIGKKRLVVSVPPAVGFLTACLLGKLVGDVMLTRDEIEGLMGNLLYVDDTPAGKTVLTEWARENKDWLGSCYASELARRKDRMMEYVSN